MMRLFSRLLILCLVFGFILETAQAASFGKPRLEIVAQLKQRPGNVAVAKDNRVFISLHPYDNPEFKVMQVLPDGTLKPFPNAAWSKEPGSDGVGLTSVVHLAVVNDDLYILDMGSDLVTPKMVAWNLKDNVLKHIWYIPNHVLTKKSFLQDFVVSPDEHNAVIADMGQADFADKPDAALIYLSLETGAAARKLVGHASLRQSQKPMRAEGQAMMFTKDGRDYPLYLGLDPITLDPTGTWMYYGPMGQGLIYKVLLRDFINPDLTADQLAQRVAVVGAKPPSDGILVDGMENIFITSVNDGSIGVLNNRGVYSTWIHDPLLSWPDGLAFGPDNGVYITVNQLHLSGMFHRGEEKSTPPYMILRVMDGRPLVPGSGQVR